MKIGIVGDVHWSKYSSIVRSRGNVYSTRLENCIESINWAEAIMTQSRCDLIVYLGDFFDKCDLNAEEITALQELKFAKIPHVFLVGNHEMGLNNLDFSSAHIFNMSGVDKNTHFLVVDKPTPMHIEGVDLYFLPYILNDVNQHLEEYILPNTKPIVFSHNDIKGIQMGPIISKVGFEIDDIEKHCKMFINGHIHNGSKVSDKIINIGNLTGQNFSEDATKYKHSIYVLDTEDMSYEVFNNTKAFNFFKFDTTNNINDIKHYIKNVSNPVVTAKVNEKDISNYDWIKDYAVASKIIIQPEIIHSNNTEVLDSLSKKKKKKFREYIVNEIGNTDVVLKELEYITK